MENSKDLAVTVENTNLVEVVQLPVITQRLQLISEQIKATTAYVLSLECNEDTYKEIKKLRAEMNKQYEELDTKRKDAKKAILAPYEEFEQIFNLLVRDVYKPAEKEISEKISAVENELKQKKVDEITDFFDEYSKSKGIDFVAFGSLSLKIGLSTSVNKMKEAIRTAIDKIVNDLILIDTQEHSAEILVEYKKSLDVSNAILVVKDRHQAIEAEQQRAIQTKAEQEEVAETVAKVESAIEEFSAPTVEETYESPEYTYKTAFKVIGTLKQMKALKKFLEEGGYEYEQLTDTDC